MPAPKRPILHHRHLSRGARLGLHKRFAPGLRALAGCAANGCPTGPAGRPITVVSLPAVADLVRAPLAARQARRPEIALNIGGVGRLSRDAALEDLP